FSRPLGDVDERAARWLAQLLDVGAIRTTLRALMVALAGAFEEPYPRASSQVARWAEEPVPDDPTQDRRWMRALVVMARTQVWIEAGRESRLDPLCCEGKLTQAFTCGVEDRVAEGASDDRDHRLSHTQRGQVGPVDQLDANVVRELVERDDGVGSP